MEPFVRPDLDDKATRPLLRLMGVRDTPAGLDKLLQRIRALAQLEEPATLLSEITKWYGALDRALGRSDAASLAEVRNAFLNEPLILTAEESWARASEVFQRNTEDFPEAPVVHPAAGDLRMWARLGVADEPTAQLVLRWIDTLPSGQPLESASAARVRLALARFPGEVWEGCRHWLSLDGTWTPVERLELRLCKRSSPKGVNFFPGVRARIADLRMVPPEVCERHPSFVEIPELDSVLEYRLTYRPREPRDLGQKSWVVALGDRLRRVRLESDAQTQHVRRVAERLARAAWYSFEDSDGPEVTPYLQGAPAGPAVSPNVLWNDDEIFVKGGKMARFFEDLVAELARPFQHWAIMEAIKVCGERDEDFIAEYMEEHFALDDETAPIGGREEEKQTFEGEAQGVAEGDDEGYAGLETSPGGSRWDQDHVDVLSPKERRASRRYRPEPSLFEKFALQRGYRWDDYQQRFVHPGGSWMERCERPFHWCQFDSAGAPLNRYWVSEQCLERDGLEIPSELWEFFRRGRSGYSMVLEDGEGGPREWPAPTVGRMVERREIVVYPAKYRIRIESEK